MFTLRIVLKFCFFTSLRKRMVKSKLSQSNWVFRFERFHLIKFSKRTEACMQPRHLHLPWPYLSTSRPEIRKNHDPTCIFDRSISHDNNCGLQWFWNKSTYHRYISKRLFIQYFLERHKVCITTSWHDSNWNFDLFQKFVSAQKNHIIRYQIHSRFRTFSKEDSVTGLDHYCIFTGKIYVW